MELDDACIVKPNNKFLLMVLLFFVFNIYLSHKYIARKNLSFQNSLD
mgnify:CR=1 FL=1